MSQTSSKLLFVLFMTCILSLACGKKSGPSTAAGAEGSGDGSSSSASDVSESDEGSAGMSSSGLPVIYFDFDQSTLSSQGRTLLQEVAENLKSGSGKLTIEGHCDERGSNEYNLALGDRRARSVKSYLQSLGIGAGRLNVISYGEERPADMGSGDAAWAKNRRAELISNN